ncbi:MAG: type II toxin-antitoxin system RelE/ParE family toxin [Vitreimonas sp.]
MRVRKAAIQCPSTLTNSSLKCTPRTSAVLDLRIRPQAQRDLKEIWRYTRRRWSREQADRYAAKIYAAIADLRKRPQLGKPADNVSPGLSRRTAERHVIYFRVRDETLVVARVLHDAMDPITHLANDET